MGLVDQIGLTILVWLTKLDWPDWPLSLPVWSILTKLNLTKLDDEIGGYCWVTKWVDQIEFLTKLDDQMGSNLVIRSPIWSTLVPSVVIIAEALVTFHDIQNGTVELGCNCKSGLTAIFSHTYDTPKQPHHDLIHEIRRKLSNSKLTWKHRHISGHQDKHIPVHLLDMWGRLNVEMDSLAKVYWNKTSTTTHPFYPPSSFGWSLWIGPRKLAS
jgi:hypothetical protein